MTIASDAPNQPVLSIFFQLDPFHPTIGGIQTCIQYILKYAPEEIRIQLVGIAIGAKAIPNCQDNADNPGSSRVGQWQTVTLYGREFDFLPLLRVNDDNVRGLIPTTVKYAVALRKYLKYHRIKSDFYQFHRIEPTIFTWGLSGTKLLYIHNDIYQEVKGNSRSKTAKKPGAKGGILWKRFPWAYFALERHLVKQFDRILSCNSDSTKLYQQQYPKIADRVSYLKNTFDSELFYPLSTTEKVIARRQLAQAHNLPESTRFILFAGRLHPQKQPELLIQAMAHLRAELAYCNVHLLIVGKGELETTVRQEIEKHNLQQHVSLLGSLPQHKLADLYRTCDLLALTSAYEGLARGSLESLACGTPVVTTKAGETPNFLTENSGLVCGAAPKKIAEAWHQVLQHVNDFPSKACVQVAQPYEARKVVTELYGQLLVEWREGNRPSSADMNTQATKQDPGEKQLALKE